jgi:hypothetical protein
MSSGMFQIPRMSARPIAHVAGPEADAQERFASPARAAVARRRGWRLPDGSVRQDSRVADSESESREKLGQPAFARVANVRVGSGDHARYRLGGDRTVPPARARISEVAAGTE